MHKTCLFPSLLALLVFIAGVHIVATYLKLYWSIPWIDFVPHFSSGLLIALSSLWFAYLSGYVKVEGRSQIRLFLLAFIPALAIGILWEVFEVYFGITSLASINYYRNNGTDVLVDVLGGISGYAYFSYRGYSRV